MVKNITTKVKLLGLLVKMLGVIPSTQEELKRKLVLYNSLYDLNKT